MGKSHERELVLHALAKGEGYEHNIGSRDLWFFVKTELITSPQIHISLGFTFFSMVLFLISFWDSSGPESLVLVAVQIIAFFAVNPFLIGLTDWRNIISEEADALMHSSVQSMLALKTVVSLTLIVVVITLAWGCLVVVLDTHVTNDTEMWSGCSLTWRASRSPSSASGSTPHCRSRSCRPSPRCPSSSWSSSAAHSRPAPASKASRGCASSSRASTCGAACRTLLLSWRTALPKASSPRTRF